jgi:hypothetical protein
MDMIRFGFYDFLKAITILDQRWHFSGGSRQYILERLLYILQ